MTYRDSHLEKGADYDDDLDRFPMDNYMAHSESRVICDLLQILFPNGIDRYLDFAGGTGRITSLIEPFASESVAIDISRSMQKIAKTKCTNTSFILGDITKNSVDLRPFNLVTAFRFFGNAEESLRESVVKELSKLTKKGGYLIFNNHRNPLSISQFLLKLRGKRSELTMNPFSFQRLLAKYDFKTIRTIGIASWVIRAKYEEERYLKSKYVGLWETVSRVPGIGMFSPDSIVIVKKIG